MAFKITTTGTLNPVPFADLGKLPGYSHPTIDYDLEQEFTIDEINSSQDVQDAITNGYITVEDEHGNNVTTIGSANIMTRSTYDKDASGGTDNPYGEVVTVAKSGGDFSSVQDAIDSITDASSSKTYVILIYPGSYSENIDLTGKPFISLKGVGDLFSTTLTSSSGTTLTFDDGSDVSVSNLRIQSLGGKIFNVPSGLSDHRILFDNCILSEVVVNSNTTAITVSSGTVVFNNCYSHYIHSGTGSGEHVFLDIVGESTVSFRAGVLISSVADASNDVYLVKESNETINLSVLLLESVIQRSGTVTGDTVMFLLNGDYDSQRIISSKVKIENSGSGGDAMIVKTSGNSSVLLSLSTDYRVKDFTNNWAFNCLTNDAINSYFDIMDASDGITGSGDVNAVHAHSSHDFHVGRDIIIDRNINISGVLELSSGTTINEISTDGTLGGNSDDAVPTEKAVKTYTDGLSSSYVKKDASSGGFTAAVPGQTPTATNHLATKGYVDSVGGDGGSNDLGPVLDKDLTAPPGGESVGDKYIVGSSATGDWSGHDDDVAEVSSTSPTTWSFTTPVDGNHAWVTDEAKDYTFSSGSWNPTGSSISHTSLQDIGTNTHAQIDSHIANTSNPHSVSKTDVGLSNVTNDAQLKRAANDISGFAEKSFPNDNDLFLIEDSADSGSKKKIKATNLFDKKVSVSSNDTVQDYLINKIIGTANKITVSEISDGGDEDLQINVGSHILDTNVAGQINGLSEKTTPVSADTLMLEDSADSNNKKKVQIGNLVSKGGQIVGWNADELKIGKTPVGKLDIYNGSTNTDLKVRGLRLDASNEEYRWQAFDLPTDMVGSDTLYFDFWWFNQSTGSGNVVFKVYLLGSSDTENWDRAWTATLTGTFAASTTAGEIQKDTISETLTNLSLSGGEHIVIQISRDASNASDTLANDAVLYRMGVRF